MGRAFGVVPRARNLNEPHRQECLCHVAQTFLSVFVKSLERG